MVPLAALVGAGAETESVWTDEARAPLHGRRHSWSGWGIENPVGTAWSSRDPTPQGWGSGEKRRGESSPGWLDACVAALGRSEGEGGYELRNNRRATSQDGASAGHWPVLC